MTHGCRRLYVSRSGDIQNAFTHYFWFLVGMPTSNISSSRWSQEKEASLGLEMCPIPEQEQQGREKEKEKEKAINNRPRISLLRLPQLNNPPPIPSPANPNKLPLRIPDRNPRIVLCARTPTRPRANITTNTATPTMRRNRRTLAPDSSQPIPPVCIEIRQERAAMLLC